MEEYKLLQESSKPFYSQTIFVNDPFGMEYYKILFTKAMDIEFHNLPTYEETRKLFCFTQVEA